MRNGLISILLFVCLVLNGQGSVVTTMVTPVVSGSEEECATSRWGFENNGTDTEGNYNLTMTNGTYSSSYKKVGSYSFDASNSGRYGTSASIAHGSGFTVEGWWMTYSESSSSRTLYTTLDASPNEGFDFRYDYSQTRLEFETGNGASTTVAYSSSFTPTLGTWYHFAAVANGSSVVLYINGSDVTSSGSVQSGYTTTGQARVGQDWNDAHYSYGFHDAWGLYLWELSSTNVDYLYDNPGGEVCQD